MRMSPAHVFSERFLRVCSAHVFCACLLQTNTVTPPLSPLLPLSQMIYMFVGVSRHSNTEGLMSIASVFVAVLSHHSFRGKFLCELVSYVCFIIVSIGDFYPSDQYVAWILVLPGNALVSILSGIKVHSIDLSHRTVYIVTRRVGASKREYCT